MRGAPRSTLVAVLVAAAVAAAVAFDVTTPSAAPRPATTSSVSESGVLGCPVITIPRAHTYIHLANVSPQGHPDARINVTVSSAGRPRSTALTLPSGGLRTIALTKVKRGAAATIEYSGGTIVASHSVWTDDQQSAAAACTHPAVGVLVVPLMRTLKAGSTLSIFNPGTADADVSVTLLADGKRLTPERLTRRIIRGGARRDFLVGDFAFNSRDVTALVHVASGAIVAGGFVNEPVGVSALEGRSPHTGVVAVVGQTNTASLVLVNPGEEPAEVTSRLLTVTAQGAAPGVPPAMDGLSAVRRTIASRDGGAAAGFMLTTASTDGLAGGGSWLARGRLNTDRAASTASPVASRFAAVAAPMMRRGASRLILLNPHDTPTSVQLRILGSTPSTLEVMIEAGRLMVIALPAGPVGVVAEASAPISGLLEVLARPQLASKRRAAFGLVAVAVSSLDPPAPVAVVLDPRTGVPAAREG